MSGGEQTKHSVWLLLPQQIRNFPADLAAVILFVIATVIFVLVPIVNETPLRVAFGLVFILFLPGYAFIAALFPEEGKSPSEGGFDSDETFDAESKETDTQDSAVDSTERDSDVTIADQSLQLSDRGIDGIERVALSFGLSIAIVPLIGLLLNFTPWGIRLLPILITVALFTLSCSGIAAVRRWNLPEEQRFRVPYREWISRGKQEIISPETRLDGVLNVLLALSIILAVGAVSFAILVPPDGERFTEFYILTEDDDEELVAADYPTDFELGEGQPVVVGIGNQEHETVEYSVVVLLQEVEFSENESVETEDDQFSDDVIDSEAADLNQTTIVEQEQIDQFSSTLSHNETQHIERDIIPTMSGENLRVQYLLYKGEPPDNPTRDNAYRDIHLWIDVHE